ncbi:unnamed protein product [Trichobilharzia szidati]|nr:unnamed protein product [Trichobilharzia szidati]
MADYKSNSRDDEDDADDNEKALKEFDNWLSNTSSTYSTIHPGRNYLKIGTNLKSGQRGLIACCNINANQCTYSIPLNDLRYILTPLRCTFLLNTCQCFLTKQSRKIQLNSFDILVTFIYHCKYSGNMQRDCFIQHIWSSYINVLPNSYPNPVSYILSSTDYNYSSIFNATCTTTNSSPYFHSHDINMAFRNILKRVIRSWHNIKPLLCQDEYTRDTPSNEFLWAWFTVNSRCVSCPMKQESSMVNIQQIFQALFKSYSQNGERNLNLITESIIQLKDDATTTTTNTDDNNNNVVHTIALIPFFDFFNHNPNIATNTRLVLSNDTNSLQLYLDQEITENEQVFINYGPHDNLTLFTEYGFSLPYLEANATTTANDVIYLSSCFLIDLFIQLYNEIKVTTCPPSVASPRPSPATTTTAAAATSTSTTTSFSSVSSPHSSSSTSQRSEYKSKGDQQSDIFIAMHEYFYLILAKLHLPQPKTSSIQDDILWKSVYVSNSVDSPNSSYYLSLILFLMYTTFIVDATNDSNISKPNHRSLDDIFNISEDLISTTIQPVLNRIYTLLLDNINYDREKILRLLKSSPEVLDTEPQEGATPTTVTATQSSCIVNDFCKEFLYYLEQRECFVQGLMMS